jgi:3-phosphoglycerate kinase
MDTKGFVIQLGARIVGRYKVKDAAAAWDAWLSDGFGTSRRPAPSLAEGAKALGMSVGDVVLKAEVKPS